MNKQKAERSDLSRGGVEILEFFDRCILKSSVELKSRVKRLVEGTFRAARVSVREISVAEDDTVELWIPPQRKYLVLPRLVMAGIGAHLSLTLDIVERHKVALAEAGNNVLEHAFEEGESDQFILYRFSTTRESLVIEVIDNGCGMDPPVLGKGRRSVTSEAGLGFFLMESLVETLEVDSEPGDGTVVRFVIQLANGRS